MRLCEAESVRSLARVAASHSTVPSTAILTRALFRVLAGAAGRAAEPPWRGGRAADADQPWPRSAPLAPSSPRWPCPPSTCRRRCPSSTSQVSRRSNVSQIREGEDLSASRAGCSQCVAACCRPAAGVQPSQPHRAEAEIEHAPYAPYAPARLRRALRDPLARTPGNAGPPRRPCPSAPPPPRPPGRMADALDLLCPVGGGGVSGSGAPIRPDWGRTGAPSMGKPPRRTAPAFRGAFKNTQHANPPSERQQYSEFRVAR